MRLLLLILLSVVAIKLQAQGSQQKYLTAKEVYARGEYATSALQFSQLVNDPVFGAFATFYLGMCHFQSGELTKSADTFGQLQVRYPQFASIEEVNFWRAFVFFQNKELLRGIQEAQKLTSDEPRRVLYSDALASLTFDELRNYQEQYIADNQLAEMLALKGLRMNLTNEQEQVLRAMLARTDIEVAEVGDFPIIKKDSYVIAAMLPFLFTGLDQADRVMRNTLVMDLYQGMQLAEEWLEQNGYPVEVLPFDTKKDVTATREILSNGTFDKVDLIIGPLYPETIELVSQFSKENKINTINPVSANEKVVENNPYAFILKPSYETMAQKAAEYMASTAKKQEVMVYFEDKGSERIIATAYKEAIQAKGMTVTNFQAIDSRSARELLAKFTNQKEVVLSITDDQLGKLKQEGRLIRNRPKYDTNGRQVMRPDGTPEIEYYEMVFTHQTPKLDHIFAVTRSNLLANNFVGVAESNPDSLRLLGLADWLDFGMLEYRQLERLRISLIHPDYIDMTSSFYNEVKNDFKRKFNREPSTFHLLGFESVWWAGNMMHRYGKYFQNGFYDIESIPSVFYGRQYGIGNNDNQLAPVVQFKNQQLKPVNLTNEQK